MKTHILVTVRFSSTRLPGKCLLEIEGKSVLEHLLNRLENVDMQPIVCTSTDRSDDIIYDLAISLGIKCFRGDLSNKLKRWADAASWLETDFVHIIDGDDPLVDVEEIASSIAAAKQKNLDLLKTSMRSDSGFASVGMSVKTTFLEIMSSRSQRLKSQDLDVIPWDLLLQSDDLVETLPDNFYFPAESEDLRLTIDYEEDFQLISEIIQVLGSRASRLEIEEFLYKNPKLININHFRALDFRTNKLRQLKQNF